MLGAPTGEWIQVPETLGLDLRLRLGSDGSVMYPEVLWMCAGMVLTHAVAGPAKDWMTRETSVG